MSSPKTLPQAGIPRLVVSTLLVLTCRWLTTWNSVAAASLGRGR